MTSSEQRQQRVRNGSHRKRDLEAVSRDVHPDFAAFAAKHFPDQIESSVKVAAFHVWMRHQKREHPDPAEVGERLRELGWAGGKA